MTKNCYISGIALILGLQPTLGFGDTQKLDETKITLPKLGDLPTKTADPVIKAIEQAAETTPKKTFKDHLRGLRTEGQGYWGFFNVNMKEPNNGVSADISSELHYGGELTIGKTLPWQELFVSGHVRYEYRGVSAAKTSTLSPRSIPATEFEVRVGRTFLDLVHVNFAYESAVQNTFKRINGNNFKFSDIRVNQFNLKARAQYAFSNFCVWAHIKGVLSLPYSVNGYRGLLGYGYEPSVGFTAKFEPLEVGVFGRFANHMRDVSEFKWSSNVLQFGAMLNYTF